MMKGIWIPSGPLCKDSMGRDVAFLTRYSSAAALCAALFSFAVALLFFAWPVQAMVGFMTLLMIWRHRENIQRLKNRTESKIGQKG